GFLNCAEGKLFLRQIIGFYDVIEEVAHLQELFECYNDTDVWFYFMNDVFWTLTEDNVNRLVALFEETKKKWP
ncbi:MAG: hypothetical protein KAJ58_02160, partial [Candidatus Pacebacteria bacterium]|nr:hypothetical protein [Candidatus Paceibacterota bacterium]